MDMQKGMCKRGHILYGQSYYSKAEDDIPLNQIISLLENAPVLSCEKGSKNVHTT